MNLLSFSMRMMMSRGLNVRKIISLLNFRYPTIASVASIKRFYHHSYSYICLLENVKVFTVKNISYTSYYIAIFLIDFKHFSSRFWFNIYKHRNLKRDCVSNFKMILNFFNALWKDSMTIHIYKLWVLTPIFSKTDPWIPVTIKP